MKYFTTLIAAKQLYACAINVILKVPGERVLTMSAIEFLPNRAEGEVVSGLVYLTGEERASVTHSNTIHTLANEIDSTMVPILVRYVTGAFEEDSSKSNIIWHVKDCELVSVNDVAAGAFDLEAPLDVFGAPLAAAHYFHMTLTIEGNSDAWQGTISATVHFYAEDPAVEPDDAMADYAGGSTPDSCDWEA